MNRLQVAPSATWPFSFSRMASSNPAAPRFVAGQRAVGIGAADLAARRNGIVFDAPPRAHAGMQPVLAVQIFAEGKRHNGECILVVDGHADALRALVGQRPNIEIGAEPVAPHQLHCDRAQLLGRQRHIDAQDAAVLLPALVVLQRRAAQTVPARPRPSTRECLQTRRFRSAAHGSGCPRAPRASAHIARRNTQSDSDRHPPSSHTSASDSLIAVPFPAPERARPVPPSADFSPAAAAPRRRWPAAARLQSPAARPASPCSTRAASPSSSASSRERKREHMHVRRARNRPETHRRCREPIRRRARCCRTCAAKARSSPPARWATVTSGESIGWRRKPHVAIRCARAHLRPVRRQP